MIHPDFKRNINFYFYISIINNVTVLVSIHFLLSGTFKQYDWGPKENMRRYHSKKPPEYNIKNITAPVAIFYGETDAFVTKEVKSVNLYEFY